MNQEIQQPPSLSREENQASGEQNNTQSMVPNNIKYQIPKKNILFKFVAILIILAMIVMVVDPMTTNINEGELIFKVVFYPYDKLKGNLEEDVEDFDQDGISDYDEIHGWKMDSDLALISKSGDRLNYQLQSWRNGEHSLSLRYRSITQQEVKLELGQNNKTITLDGTASEFDEEILFNMANLSAGFVEFSLELVGSGGLSIDWVRLQKVGEFSGFVADGDDFFASQGGSNESNIQITTEEIRYRTDWKNPDSDFDQMQDGYELATGKAGEGWCEPMVTNQRYAVLIGGGSGNQEGNYRAFANGVVTVYEALHNSYGYLNRNIHVLFWEGDDLAVDIVDRDGSLDSITATFDALGTQSTENDLLFIYISSHGSYNASFGRGQVAVYDDPRENPEGETIFTFPMLKTEVMKVTSAEKILVIDACNSGSAALAFEAIDNVQIYTSSTKEDETFAYPDGTPPFTHHFMQALVNPILGAIPTFDEIKNLDVDLGSKDFISLGEAYRTTKAKLKLALNDNPFEGWSTQQPQQNNVAELKGEQIFI